MGFFTRRNDEKRFLGLEEDLRKLKRDMEGLELEWSNAFDKLKVMMQRIAKRAEVAEKAEAQGEQTVEPGSAATSLDPRSGRLLNPRQTEIQQQILRRRAGG